MLAAEAPAPASTAWVSAAPLSATAPPPSIAEIPAGDYKLDPSHSSLLVKVSHLGFSHFTAWFDAFGADLKLDPANPSAAGLSVDIEAASLNVHAPPAGFVEELRADKFVDSKNNPKITFKSTAIAMTGPNTADVTGDLVFRGITKPVTLKVTYNGGYKGHMYEPKARIGFSATGVFNRSDFGMDYGVPAPGASMGTGDEITIVIETEFQGPPMQNPPTVPPQ